MLKLDQTTRKLQAVLSGAVTTNQLPCMVSYSDDNGTTYVGGTQLTNTNSTTAVDICAAPGASTVRDIDYMSIRNRDTAAATVTVMLDDNGTDYEIVKAALAVGDQLIYTHGDGWRVIDADGNLKTGGSSGTGDVVGPASATADSLARFDGNTGKLLKDGAVIGTDVQAYAGAIMSTPGGRLTLSSATPVMTSDVSNSTSIYYTPYIHDKVPIYDGTGWIITTFTELTNTTTDNTVNPAAVAANSNYDLFVWSDSGTIRLGRGPAWTSATARGTGAGTTELERVNGIWMNKIAITNGPAAQRGTYVGTIRSDASSTIDWELGGSAAGGDPGFLNVWNMYNRRPVRVQVSDTTDSWTYGTSATWRAANNSSSNRVSYVCGMAEDGVTAYWHIQTSGSVSGFAVCGIGVDSTTSASGITFRNGSTTVTPMAVAAYDGIPGLGSHYVSAVEYTDNGSTPVTFYGDGGTSYYLGGLRFTGEF